MPTDCSMETPASSTTGAVATTTSAPSPALELWPPAGTPPTHPDTAHHEATVVNLGYVINVIEDPTERAEALTTAWGLTGSVLVVSARLTWDPDSQTDKPYRDGRLTSNGTFQKFYTPEELKAWIETTLRTAAVTAAPGVYYVFRNLAGPQKLLARHSRNLSRPRQGIAELLYAQRREALAPIEAYVTEHRRLPPPSDLPNGAEAVEAFGSIRAAFSVIRRVTGVDRWNDVDLGTRKRSEQRFEEHLDDLQPLIDFVTERGRLPRTGELDNEDTLTELFGSPRAAVSLIRRVTGPDRWQDLEEEARQNFLVYAALAAFGGRLAFRQLPEDLQYDAKDLFGSYRAACAVADELLYSIADVALLDVACRDTPFGKLTPEALYVHTSAVAQLPPLLRVYVGAAETIIGNVDDATIVKLHRQKPQVSFLIYPDIRPRPTPRPRRLTRGPTPPAPRPLQRLLRLRQPADSSPQGSLRTRRLPGSRQIHTAHAPRRTRRPPRRPRHRQTSPVGAAANRSRSRAARSPTRPRLATPRGPLPARLCRWARTELVGPQKRRGLVRPGQLPGPPLKLPRRCLCPSRHDCSAGQLPAPSSQGLEWCVRGFGGAGKLDSDAVS